MKIEQGFELKELNTFAMACKASYYIDVESKEDALILPRDEYFRTLPIMIKGGGSNLLFVGDFRGAVLHYSGKSITTIHEDEHSILLRIEAGKNWHELVIEMVEKGLWGIENLAYIPGEVGASAVQNIGAYGAEVEQVIETVHSINLETGEEVAWEHDKCDYAYRHSIFKERENQFHLIYAVDIRLSKTPTPNLEYSGLQSLQSIPNISPKEVAERVIEIRRSKLPDPAEFPNAGSFFMNPVVDRQTFAHLLLKYPSMPHYIISEDEYKIPAAWFIEQSGLKGIRQGNVGTYPHQPLLIINYGGAYSHEVVEFADMVISTVKDKFGIELHPEVRYIRSGAQDSIR